MNLPKQLRAVPSVLRDVPYDKFDARIITEAAQKGDSLALEETFLKRATIIKTMRAVLDEAGYTEVDLFRDGVWVL